MKLFYFFIILSSFVHSQNYLWPIKAKKALTAVFGEDANWGRIIMAIGKSYEKINQNNIKVSFGKNTVCKNGQIFLKYDLA